MREYTSHSLPQLGQEKCSPAIYPCAPHTLKVGVSVKYGRREFSQIFFTSAGTAAGSAMRSPRNRCTTVPPVYLVCRLSWMLSASTMSSVYCTGRCDELV